MVINCLKNVPLSIYRYKANKTKLQTELNTTKEKLKQSNEQKVHFETLYNQIVAESYFPHLYGRSENLRAANVKSKIIPLPQNPDEILNFTEPLKTYNDTIEKSNMKENESNDVIKKLNSKFDLNL